MYVCMYVCIKACMYVCMYVVWFPRFSWYINLHGLFNAKTIPVYLLYYLTHSSRDKWRSYFPLRYLS